MKSTITMLLAGLFLSACGGSSLEVGPTATIVPEIGASTLSVNNLLENGDLQGPSEESSQSGLSAEVGTYYKTMVFIHGTAQLMSRFDLAAITSSDDQSLILMLIAMPGVMDDHLIAANKLPVPAGLETAWQKASTAEANLIQALQDVLTTYDLDSFAQATTSNEVLALDAMTEAEEVLVDRYGASADDISAANRAALSEMGEAYKSIASMLLVGQAQSEDGSE